MNIFIWILQGLLAAVFLMAGVFKVFTPYSALREKMAWTEDFSAGTIKMIGLAEFAGSVGLILPALLNIYPILSVVAAFALGLIMLLAMRTHLRRKEQREATLNVTLLVFALAVALLQLYF